ncbi:hypothetical protein KIN20_002807 [Parelaphostrongylus tenuis]|uniref:Uncharacterized protein n=1 Tax=Parelaphostrongylus tenuis TaxID=148309 RepID=A0AAD5QH07_PARTN|nr:hypothetical protein KIN20_002807 [Parelaphostrongylus tenuis]
MPEVSEYLKPLPTSHQKCYGLASSSATGDYSTAWIQRGQFIGNYSSFSMITGITEDTDEYDDDNELNLLHRFSLLSRIASGIPFDAPAAVIQKEPFPEGNFLPDPQKLLPPCSEHLGVQQCSYTG